MATVVTKTQIVDLPTEVIDKICSNLDKYDLQEFRLGCRVLKEKSYHQFAVSHFRVYPLMITRDSLEELVRVAKDKTFGPCIKELELYLVIFPEMMKRSINGEPLNPDGTPVQESAANEVAITPGNDQRGDGANVLDKKRKLKRLRRRRFGQYQVSQNTLQKQGTDVSLLTEALQHLPALNKISISDGSLASLERSRIGTKIQSDIGRPLLMTHRHTWSGIYERETIIPPNLHCISHALALTFGALVRSGINSRGSFCVQGSLFDLVVPRHATSRKVTSAGTPATTFCEDQLKELKATFSGLEMLELRTNPSEPSPIETSSKLLKLFAFLCPAVQKLHISGCTSGVEVQAVKSLASSKDMFPQLRCIILSHVCVRQQDLTDIIRNHASTLSYVNLDSSYCLDMSISTLLQILTSLKGSTNMVGLRYVAQWGSFHPRITQRGQISFFALIRKTPADFQIKLEELLGSLASLAVNEHAEFTPYMSLKDLRCPHQMLVPSASTGSWMSNLR
ncbi:hypothetical protein K491DRAFT_723651 [Lophiostoma macrostomum CBS 122681]|uniref:F-box domain-containing protein n=1 Tax=Lophiostoma macrostomum CBS 122681 TaxID=1314788 RepID=A0A6A6SHY8_9PLEO|nr:hypothetical protein K491DRAFT_723651 [Lophiostoma macrostomum CBS 122681]